MTYTLQRSFSCAHFYHQTQWSEQKNRAEFGLCFTEFGHGHDYTLEIEFKTQDLNQARTDFNNLLNRLDHQHLNFIIPEFKVEIPTTENLSLYLKSNLENLFHKHHSQLLRLKLSETPEIWTEV